MPTVVTSSDRPIDSERIIAKYTVAQPLDMVRLVLEHH
jgi:hypothetical protein